jgi:hypothetical protein
MKQDLILTILFDSQTSSMVPQVTLVTMYIPAWHGCICVSTRHTVYPNQYGNRTSSLT